jgi:hypothetical protein
LPSWFFSLTHLVLYDCDMLGLVVLTFVRTRLKSNRKCERAVIIASQRESDEAVSMRE